MLSRKRLSSKAFRVTKLHRRHRSLPRHRHKLLTLSTHSKILFTNKVSSGNDNKVSSIIITDHHSSTPYRLVKRSTTAIRPLSLIEVGGESPLVSETNNVSIDTTTNHQMNSSDIDSKFFNHRTITRIFSCPKQTRSRHDHSEVNNLKKERKKFQVYCHSCTPLCVFLSILAACLIAATVATILLVVLLKKQAPTTLITTTIIISTTSSTTLSTTSSTTLSTTSSTTLSTTSSTSTTTSTVPYFSCLNQTWTSSAGLLAKWTFDGTFSDQMNTYNAIPVNNPSFISSGYVNQALILNASSNQYLYTSYIPLINASFTIELWFYPTGYPNPTDHSLLGLCTLPSNDRCLHLTVRNVSGAYFLYMSFFGDQLPGNTAVPLNQWTHAAFVFDLISYNASIYQNGLFVGGVTFSLPLQGITNNVTIGYIPGIVAAYGTNFFQGYIDQLTIVNRAKPTCEILDDATLATYYNFDNNPLVTDAGPNSLSSVSQNVSFVSSGHISNAISFNYNSSYFEVDGLTGLGTANKSFSISLWIQPYSLSGTIVFVQNGPLGLNWCLPFIGFANNGSIVAQIWGGPTRSIFGSALSIPLVWHHIVQTWSSTNGLRLYVDSVLVASYTSAVTYAASSVPNNVKLANRQSAGCAAGGLGSQLAFHGAIDEFRVYSRELTVDDVFALFNYL